MTGWFAPISRDLWISRTTQCTSKNTISCNYRTLCRIYILQHNSNRIGLQQHKIKQKLNKRSTFKLTSTDPLSISLYSFRLAPLQKLKSVKQIHQTPLYRNPRGHTETLTELNTLQHTTLTHFYTLQQAETLTENCHQRSPENPTPKPEQEPAFTLTPWRNPHSHKTLTNTHFYC